MRAPCHDCRIDVHDAAEFYMVENHIWKEAAPEDLYNMSFFLCIGCIEHRLGRQLQPEDFSDCPGNAVWERSPRLASRMLAS